MTKTTMKTMIRLLGLVSTGMGRFGSVWEIFMLFVKEALCQNYIFGCNEKLEVSANATRHHNDVLNVLPAQKPPI